MVYLSKRETERLGQLHSGFPCGLCCICHSSEDLAHGEAGIQEERQGACLGLSLDRTQDLRLPQKLTGDGILCHSGGNS